MSRILTPTPTLSSRPNTQFTSLANIKRRVYPLNLSMYGQQEIQNTKRRSCPKVPEFIREYIKNSGKPNSLGKVHSTISHERSKSYQFASAPVKSSSPEPTIKQKIPLLSYKEYISRHLDSKHEEKLFIPQMIHISKRSKIILHASKPISVNPELYVSRKESVHNRNSSTNDMSKIGENNIDITSVMTPGLTYGEKILKLKALVTSNLI